MFEKLKIYKFPKVIIAIVFLCICGGFLLGNKFIRHEERQNNLINELQTQNNELKNELLSQREYFDEKINQSINYFEYDTHYTEDTYNYFAIGNSLTLIKSWGRGICSTRPDNDYFHLIVKYLKKGNDNVIAHPFNFAMWERSNNRSSNLKLLDVFLSINLDLVTIQLGENIGDLTTFQSDLESLIEYVPSKAPKAKIIVIGDWWDKNRNELRKAAALNKNAIFVDLSDIMNKREYQSREGIECIGINGTKVFVSKAAETHPGDAGMEEIADRVIDNL